MKRLITLVGILFILRNRIEYRNQLSGPKTTDETAFGQIGTDMAQLHLYMM